MIVSLSIIKVAISYCYEQKGKRSFLLPSFIQPQRYCFQTDSQNVCSLNVAWAVESCVPASKIRQEILVIKEVLFHP
jgi:hypothetical protein